MTTLDVVLLPLLTALALLVWYLSFTATRLDRLHHKVEAARAALDLQFLRRAHCAERVALFLDPASGLLLTDAADAACDVRSEAAQDGLTQALARTLPAAPGQVADESLADLRRACERVRLARRFHNEAVLQTQRVRRKRVVRWGRLAGHAALPQTVELDDDLPALS